MIGGIRVAQSRLNGTYALAVDQLRDRLFVATEPGTLVTELNTVTGAVVATFGVDLAAYEMAVDQTTGRLYVTNYHQVTVFTPSEPAQATPEFPDYVVPLLLAGIVTADAVMLYMWRFRPSAGRPGAPGAPRRRDPASQPSSRRRPRAHPLRSRGCRRFSRPRR